MLTHSRLFADFSPNQAFYSDTRTNDTYAKTNNISGLGFNCRSSASYSIRTDYFRFDWSQLQGSQVPGFIFAWQFAQIGGSCGSAWDFYHGSYPTANEGFWVCPETTAFAWGDFVFSLLEKSGQLSRLSNVSR